MTYGLFELAERRQAGKKPKFVVVRLFKTKPSADWWKTPDMTPTIWIEHGADMPDLLPLIGLDVTLYADHWTTQAADLFEELTKLCVFVLVVSPELQDVGFKWHRSHGTVLLGETWEAAA
jgi:hypothetical protein